MSSTIKKNLLLFFHLNIFYSSIKESKRPQVIKNCYWPILNIAEKNNIKIGIEISGHTLEVIKELDNYWIIKLRFLIKKNLIFIIGSGYSQIIGPLVPYKVNIYNYKIGNQIYKKILNQKLKTLLINEQTFSKSLIDIIKKNSYNSIIIDRDNLNLINNFQRFKTTNIKGFSYKLKVIWNSFLHNQKFQKYIYDKLNLDQYLFFLKEQIIKKNQFALLYGGDAEIFNFRPKITDHNKVSNLHKKHEWKKIENLLILLNKNYNFLSLAEILKNKYSDKKVLIDLTDAKFPCITKKQPKYNITRWALSGVNDFKINTYCYKIYDFLIKKKINKINDWKKLCYFWTSDFRTHITKERWKKFNASLTKYVNRIRLYDSSNNKFKINFLKKFDLNFLSSKSDLKKYINYFNYCIETSGSAKMIELGLSIIKSNGKIIFASHPAKSERIRINPHDLIQGKKIYGSWGGCCKPDKDIKKIFKFFNDKNIFSQNLKIKKYKLNQISLAFKDILKGKSHRAIIKF